MVRAKSPYEWWTHPIRDEIQAKRQQLGLKFKSEIGELLGIGKSFNGISIAEAISSDVEAYAKLFRIGIVSADPTKIPPRITETRGVRKEIIRAWTPQKYTQWLTRQQPLPEIFTRNGHATAQPQQVPQEPASRPDHRLSTAPTQPTPPIQSQPSPATAGRIPASPFPTPGDYINGWMDNWAASMASQVANTVAAPLLASLTQASNGIVAELNAQLSETQNQVRHLTDLVGALSFKVDEGQRNAATKLQPAEPTLEEALSFVIDQLKKKIEMEDQQSLSPNFDQLHQLFVLLLRVTPERQETVTTEMPIDIGTLIGQLTILLQPYFDGNAEGRNTLVIKYGHALSELFDLVDTLTKSPGDRENIIRMKGAI